MEKRNRIILFWILTILGFLAHSLADALPAFWGQNIVAQQGPAPVAILAMRLAERALKIPKEVLK